MLKPVAVLTLAVVIAVGFTTTSAQDRDVTITPVAGSVYMLEGMGGNIGVCIGDDGVILVDDQMAPVLDKIREAIAGLSAGDLRFIINTHYHGDHVGNNETLGDEATIIAHSNTRRRLITAQDIKGETRAPLDPSGWPVITFDDAVTIHFNGEDIQVSHVSAGHTDGDAVVYFTASNVLHLGDQLFTGHFPYVDLDHGGTVAGYAANLSGVLDEFPADARVIPGHGPLSTVDDVRTQRDMVVETVKIVRGRMAAGKSLEETQAEGLPSQYDAFDWDFISTDRWIETIWKSYSN
ncbi:MAG TPA: MBL fold metallo-hydrolase [Chromatiales bacterium]|nr:MBL fold metallo-hydrolase [Chromatiales bacterium]